MKTQVDLVNNPMGVLCRWGWRMVLAIAVVSLFGCAAQSAFREGHALMAQGRQLEGLGKLEEASKLEPTSAEYKIAYLQAKDRYASNQLERAQSESAQAHYDEAEHIYREMLQVRAQQDRALMGLRQLDQHRRWDLGIQEAEKAIALKDFVSAQGKLRSVLLESPQNTAALKLMRRIEQLVNRPAQEPSLASGYKQPITIEFKDVPLRTVFEVISRTSRLNFIFDKEVKTDQRTSIYLRNSTVESAVNWLLLTNQLAQRVLDGSSILIYPSTDAKQREYQPLMVKSFYLANAEAKNVASTLKTVLKSKDVVVDEKLNLVILRDSIEAIRLAEKLVALHDVQEPEVMLEVEILEVKRGRLLDLGVRWPDQFSLSLLPTQKDGALTLADLRNPTRSQVGVTVGSTSVIAKAQDSDANILANPRIRARNREKAKILIGERVPNITTTSTATGFISESVNYIDVGLKLEVEPTVYLDDEVAIKVALEVSNIVSQQQTKAGSTTYQLGTRTAQTVLRLKDGENQVLAGLINNEDRRSANKIPLFGELPLLGRLFGDQSDEATKTEIVLSITPRILRNVRQPDTPLLEFESGTESNLRTWPADAGGVQSVGVNSAPGSSPATLSSGTSVGAISSQRGAAPSPTTTVTSDAGGMPGMNQLRWEGPTKVNVGETFTLQLTMQSEQPIANLPLVIGFDPKVLQVLAVTEGSFLKDGGAQTEFSQKVDNGSGNIVTSGARADKSHGAVSPGVAVTLSLRVHPTATTNETSLRVLSAMPTTVTGASFAMPSPAPFVLTVTR